MKKMMIVDTFTEKVSLQNIKIASINIMDLEITEEETTDQLQAKAASDAVKKAIFREIALSQKI